MCFSFEVSISTFIVSWGISIYLLNKGLVKWKKQNVIFLMIFPTIQIADAILWYNNMDHNNINYIITSYVIPLILSLQFVYNIFVRNNNKNHLITILAIIFIIYIFYRFNGYSKSLCNNNLSSPIWGSKEIELWELVLFAIVAIYPEYDVILFVFIYFFLIKIVVGGAYGSLWCAVGNIIALYYLFTY